MKTLTTLAIAMVSLIGSPALAAGDSWDSIRADLYGTRSVQDGSQMIAIDAPYRSPDDARTDLAAQVVAPVGLTIARVTLVLDENPMPVSAVFELDVPQTSFFFDVTMRVNGPTPLHVVAETADGQLFVAETFVKTSGSGACAAPPGTDPKLALATLGQMHLAMRDALPGVSIGRVSSLNTRLSRMDLDISHPSHSGMQMDQISMLFIPMRYVETVKIDLDGAGYVSLTGSISLSENPQLGLSVPGDTSRVSVTMTDTDGTVSKVTRQFGGF